MDAEKLFNIVGSPPEQIVCDPVMVLAPVNPFTRIVKDAESLQLAPLDTRTKITFPSARVSVLDTNSESKVFPETPAVCCEPFT